MVKIFCQQEVSEVCYIFEAARWLSLGRLPPPEWDEDGNEARQSPQYHDDHFVPIFDDTLFLMPWEIEEFLPLVNAEDVERTYQKTGGQSPEEILNAARLFRDKFKANAEAEVGHFIEKHMMEAEAQAEAARWLYDVLAPIHHRDDLSRAKIFLELAGGRLTARGFRLRFDEDRDVQFCEVVEIPKECWTLSTTDWRVGGTRIDGEKIIGAHVGTRDLLELFPRPDVEPTAAKGVRYGGAFLLEDGKQNSNSGSQIRPRGRPKKHGGLMETAAKREILRLKEKKLLSDKAEANIAHIQEWCEHTFGETPARTSVQRWISRS